MKNKTLERILKKTKSVIENDHFVYTSEKHGSLYINKDAIYPHTHEASQIGKMFAQKFKKLNIDAVVAPAIGGIVLSQWTAYYLSRVKKKEILGMYTEKNLEKNQVFTRGYDKLISGKKVLVIEDLTTTGGSVKKVINSIVAHGGKVVAVGVMVNRDPKNVNSETIGYPFYALGELYAKAYDEKDCPLCKKKIPINVSVGHGKKFLQEKNKH